LFALTNDLALQLQNLSRRGLHATALEMCKLLLALDPADPLGALFLIDYLALRSRQFAWLARFAEEWSPALDNRADGGGGLEMLPNFAYSLALAAFWREREPSGAAAALVRASLSIVCIIHAWVLHKGLDACARPACHQCAADACQLSFKAFTPPPCSPIFPSP
jgi:hypothetical protein